MVKTLAEFYRKSGSFEGDWQMFFGNYETLGSRASSLLKGKSEGSAGRSLSASVMRIWWGKRGVNSECLGTTLDGIT